MLDFRLHFFSNPTGFNRTIEELKLLTQNNPGQDYPGFNRTIEELKQLREEDEDVGEEVLIAP